MLMEFSFNLTGKAGEYQVILKKIDLPIVPRGKCVDLLKKTRLGPNYKLHESFICAGGEIGKDTCQVRMFNFLVIFYTKSCNFFR